MMEFLLLGTSGTCCCCGFVGTVFVVVAVWIVVGKNNTADEAGETLEAGDDHESPLEFDDEEVPGGASQRPRAIVQALPGNGPHAGRIKVRVAREAQGPKVGEEES